MWVIIHCIIISVLVSMVYASYQQFELKPLVTSMEANDIETTKISFPGISRLRYFLNLYVCMQFIYEDLF